jgi:antitoxin HicB
LETIYKLPLLLVPQPEGGYTVTCPLVPELVSEGDTVREALANATDALTAIVEACDDLCRALPGALQQIPPDVPIWFETAVVVG